MDSLAANEEISRQIATELAESPIANTDVADTPATRIRPSRRSASAAPRDHVEQCDRVGRSLQAAAPCYRRRGSLLSGTREGSRLRIRSRTLDPGRVARRRAQDARRRAALPDAEPAYRAKRQQHECTFGCARTRQALRRPGIVGQRTGSPRQSAFHSNSATTFASELKKSNAFSRNAPTKPLDFPSVVLYATYSMTGVEIRALREKLGWTQMALAEAVGVTSNTVARWERGEMAISEPAARLLQKIAAEQRSRTGKR